MHNLTGKKTEFFLKRKTLASICGLALGAFVFFLAREAFLVDTVLIEGTKAIPERSILKRIGMPSAGGKIFLLPGVAEREIGKDPWVKNVSVKSDFRGTVSIKVEEKKPFCLFAAPDGVFFYIESSGAVLGRAPVSGHGMDFPVLRSHARFLIDGVLILDLSLSARNAPGWDDISEVVSDGDGVEIFTRDGRTIEFGPDLRVQWVRLEKITRNLYVLGLKAKYINLRRHGVGIVGLKKS